MSSVVGGFPGHTLYFKHVYGRDVGKWGVLGFPTTQPANKAGGRYHFGDPVLLAVPTKPKPIGGEGSLEGIIGTIFAVCTLACIADTSTRNLANPDLARQFPQVVERWSTALPVVEAWNFDEPCRYERFGNRALLDLARVRRGHLIPINDARLDAELRAWLAQAPRTATDVFHSPRVVSYLSKIAR